LIAIVLAACSTGAAAPILAPVGGPQDQPQPVQPGSGNGSTQGGSGSGGTTPVLYDPGTPNLQIIKTGTLALQVDGIDAALANATQKIATLGGYTSGSQRQGDGDKSTASVTYRIPAQRWDDALVVLRGLATKVLGEQTQSEDVTTKIVDLSARITNLQATEQALQGIMLKAMKISDILAVQAQLTGDQGPDRAGNRRAEAPYGAGDVLDAHRHLRPQGAGSRRDDEEVRSGDRGRPGIGKSRRRLPVPGDRGHLVRDRLAADPRWAQRHRIGVRGAPAAVRSVAPGPAARGVADRAGRPWCRWPRGCSPCRRLTRAPGAHPPLKTGNSPSRGRRSPNSRRIRGLVAN